MTEYIVLGLGLALLPFLGAIRRIVKVKVFKTTLRELESIGVESVEDKMDAYMTKVIEAKIPTP